MLRFMRFLQTKIFSKKWMMSVLLIGNILLIAICSSCPMYIDAAQTKALNKSLHEVQNEKGIYPGTMKITVYSRANADLNKRRENIALGREQLTALPASIDNTPLAVSESIYVSQFKLRRDSNKNAVGVNICTMNDLESHITVEDGTGFADTGNTISILVSDRTLFALELRLGDTFTADQLNDKDGNPIVFQVVGTFVTRDVNDPYWQESPSTLTNWFFITEESFEKYILNDAKNNVRADWRIVLDTENITPSALQSTRVAASNLPSDFSYSTSYGALLDSSMQESKRVTLTLWVLQALTLLLLLVFLFMVSSQSIQMELSEISVYKSRGASRKQIVLMYLLQSSLLAVAGMIVGIPLGVFFCQTIGSANEFLQFVSRKALPIRMTASVWLFAVVAAILSILVTLIPVVRQSRIDIVQAKRAKQEKHKKPLWNRLFADILLLAAALYTWYTSIGKTDKIAMALEEGESISPLLFLAAPLFLIGCVLFVLRIFPYLMRGIFAIGKKLWNPALYASFLNMIRQQGSRGFLMAFLMLTVASGVYYSIAACSINTNAEECLYYESGADLVVQETWVRSGSGASVAPPTSVGESSVLGGFIEPDYSIYARIPYNYPEVESMTRVYSSSDLQATIKNIKTVDNVQLMGINTKEFGETANMNEGLLPTDWYNYLNAISQNINGVLVSTNFHDDYGVELGDSITYHLSTGGKGKGVVAGFVDYFPTYKPTIEKDGQIVPQYLVVANFAKIYQIGREGYAIPYQIWMKLNGSSQFIYDFAEENNLLFSVFRNMQEDQIALKNEPLFQGTNGVLTIGFIVTLLLCAVGFLMYWIFSIRERQLQFGIFRAMGMTTGEVMLMLGCEQLFVSGLSVLMGYVIGRIAAKLYVPLIQVAYSSADQVLPLDIVVSGGDLAKLFIIVGLVILICLGVIVYMLRRLKISQALKLGED